MPRKKRAVEAFDDLIRVALGLSKPQWKELIRKRLAQEAKIHERRELRQQAKKEAA